MFRGKEPGLRRLRAGPSGVRIAAGARDFSLILNVQAVLGPTQPPIHWVQGYLARVQRPGRDVDHSTLCSAGIKNEWSFVTPICLHGVERGTLTFIFSFEGYLVLSYLGSSGPRRVTDCSSLNVKALWLFETSKLPADTAWHQKTWVLKLWNISEFMIIFMQHCKLHRLYKEIASSISTCCNPSEVQRGFP
jgi:hypothetical protein